MRHTGWITIAAALGAVAHAPLAVLGGDASLGVKRVDPGDRPDAALSEHYLTDMEDEDTYGEDGTGAAAAAATTTTTALETGADARAAAVPVTDGGDLDSDLTRAGALGGTKRHHIDARTSHDVETEIKDKLVVDYQMDFTLYPSMDHTLTPYAKTAPPLEYVGSGVRWTRSFDALSAKNVSGWDFESGKGFWLDLGKWHREAMPTHTYTVDIVFKMHEGGGMRRIMSKTADSEEGLYVYDDKLVYWPHILHTNPDAFKHAKINKGEWVRVTLTRDGQSKQITGAVNGKPVWILPDTSGAAVLPEGKLNLFSDLTRYASSGTLGRVRIYNTALGYRHVKLLGRHAVDSVVRHYVYGRRIYRNLVIGDYQLQNTLVSSVFTEFPLFINNRTFVDPEYAADRIEGRRPAKVNLKIPKQGLTYALDSAQRMHNFDGEEFTFMLLVKLSNRPDEFQNLLEWRNAQSQVTLRVRNWQLYLSTRDKGDDLHDAMHSGHKSRAKGRSAVAGRLHEYLQSSQNEVLHRRLVHRMKRVREAEIEEARIRQVETAKAEQEGMTPGRQPVEGKPRKPLLVKEEELRELRIAAGLEPRKKGSSSFTPHQFETARYEWETRHAEIEHQRRLERERDEAEIQKEKLAQQQQQEKDGATPVTAISEDEGLLDAGEAAELAGPAEPASAPPMDAGGAASLSAAAADSELLVEMLADELLSREATTASEEEPDLWEEEIKAHLPRTSLEEADRRIEECFLRGGKWRFDPIDACSLDVENDIDQPPRPYDVRMDLATSIHDSVKTDKWAAIAITRSLDGRIECYVNGRRSLRYLDRNTTSTAIRGDNLQILSPTAHAPRNFDGQVGRFIVYDQHLRSTEIREMVRGTKWTPPSPINPDVKAGNIVLKKTESIPNCLVFIPIWNARSSHPGVDHGATMLWVRNYCRRDIQVAGKLCDAEFECNAQARSIMSCGTVTDSYCSVLGGLKEVKDNSF